MRGAMLPIVRDVAEPMGSVEQENPAINAAETGSFVKTVR